MFQMEGAIMLTSDKFTSVGKGSRKLRCDHITVVRSSLHPHPSSSHWRLGNCCACGSDSSYSDSSSNTSEDGDNGTGERGAELHSVSVVAPLNMDSDTSQQSTVKISW
jgi:hypothetical protein